MQRNREEDIRALLEFGRRLLKSPEFTHYNLYRSFATSRSHNLSTSRSRRALISYLAYLWWSGWITNDPRAVVTLLAKHVGDCDGGEAERLRV
jgi:hypothetical protein